MTSRPLAVSLVAFDGHPVEAALDAIAASGATHAEPAFIDGTMDFTEDDFTEGAAMALAGRIAAAGLGCLAVSAHMDCGAARAAARLIRRVRFAAALGAGSVITNSARTDRRAALAATLDQALPVAEACGVTIAFENPGHGASDLLATGRNAQSLLASLASPRVAFNYDPGNVLTNGEGAARPEAEFSAALPACARLHVKDMAQVGDHWVYGAIGDGAIGWRAMLAIVPASLPVCVELPLRQVRPVGHPPRRGPPTDLALIRGAVARSMAFMRGELDGYGSL